MTSKKIIFFLCSIAVVSLFLSTLWRAETVPFEFPENKVWAHRQNSREKILKTVVTGFKGIEMDVWYLNGVFTLSHGEPEKVAENTLESRPLNS